MNEKQRRLLLAAEARSLGWGGIAQVARASGVSRPTIQKALHERERPITSPKRVRQVGGGRKQSGERDPALLAELEALVDPVTRGDPMSPLRWTGKTPRQLAAAPGPRGHPISYRVVAEGLREAGYSLQATAKAQEGARPPAAMRSSGI